MNRFISLDRAPRFNAGRAFSLLALSAMTGGLAASAQAPVFTSGNLVVSRSVYAGNSGSVTVGETLPPNCVANKANKVTCARQSSTGHSPKSSTTSLPPTPALG